VLVHWAESNGSGSMSAARQASIYLRVSTDGQTVENQRHELEQLARARGFDVLQVYEEVESARKRRPAFERMMADARRGRFSVLLIWAIDRFGRSMVGNLTDVVELDRLGVRIVSASEGWLDTDGPARSLLIAVFSWQAEQELERLRQRTRSGLARARREGRKLGRPRATVDLDAALTLRRRGVSLGRSAEKLGVSRATLARTLRAYRASLKNPSRELGSVGCDPALLATTVGPSDA
jgi:putative DNA-invertase from lambdoid prophage Rac